MAARDELARRSRRRCPARGSSIRRSSRGSATSSCSRGRSSTASSTGCTARRIFGASIDFAEHRGYVAGDDIRRVDWRLYARTDRYYVKQYEADTNTNFSVLLDVSKSMGFGEPGHLEARIRVATSAACLAYLAHRQRDRVGIITFDDDIVTHVPPSAKHFNVAAAHARSGEGRAARAARRGRSTRWRSTSSGAASCVLISDFYEDPDVDPRGDEAAPLPRQRPDRVPRARSGRARLRYNDASSFEDLESGEQIPVVPESFGDAVPQADARSTSTR